MASECLAHDQSWMYPDYCGVISSGNQETLKATNPDNCGDIFRTANNNTLHEPQPPSTAITGSQMVRYKTDLLKDRTMRYALPMHDAMISDALLTQTSAGPLSLFPDNPPPSPLSPLAPTTDLLSQPCIYLSPSRTISLFPVLPLPLPPFTPPRPPSHQHGEAISSPPTTYHRDPGKLADLILGPLDTPSTFLAQSPTSPSQRLDWQTSTLSHLHFLR